MRWVPLLLLIAPAMAADAVPALLARQCAWDARLILLLQLEAQKAESWDWYVVKSQRGRMNLDDEYASRFDRLLRPAWDHQADPDWSLTYFNECIRR